MAAKTCHVSQPTLSAQFRKLEKELGIALIDPSAKGVVFTEAGLEVLNRAKRILNDTNEIYDIGAYYKNPRAGTLKMAVIPTVGPYVLPLIVKPLKKAFPDLKFHFFEKQTKDIIKALEEGAIDVGLLATPLEIIGLQEEALYHESFLLALPKNHSKAKGKVVEESWLKNENILLLDDGHCFKNQALSFCSKFSHNEFGNYRGASLEILKSMVEIGTGVTLIPELTASFWKKSSSSLAILPFPEPIPQREIGLMFRKVGIRKKVYLEIANLIKETIKGKIQIRRCKKELIPLDISRKNT